MLRGLSALMITILMTMTPGCLDGDDGQTNGDPFPAFSAVADNGETYDNARMDGSPYIVIFSAEWCSAPCHSTMHAIWNAHPELPVLVFSTDPAQDPQGITLQDWHEAADQYDDDGEDKGVNLTTYAFMKGVEAAHDLEVTKPGTTVFVNSDGDITYIHEGRMDDQVELIKEKWAEASE